MASEQGWSSMTVAPTYQYVLLKSAPLEVAGSGIFYHEYAVAQFEDWDEPGWFDQDGMPIDFAPSGFIEIPGEGQKEAVAA